MFYGIFLIIVVVLLTVVVLYTLCSYIFSIWKTIFRDSKSPKNTIVLQQILVQFNNAVWIITILDLMASVNPLSNLQLLQSRLQYFWHGYNCPNCYGHDPDLHSERLIQILAKVFVFLKNLLLFSSGFNCVLRRQLCLWCRRLFPLFVTRKSGFHCQATNEVRILAPEILLIL